MRRKLFKRLLVIWFVVLMVFFISLYVNGRDAWEQEASGYPTRHEYVMLNNIAIFRFLVLKAGIPDDSWLAHSMEAASLHYYENGIAHIPEEDAERLHWRYLHYLYPYHGWFLEPQEIANQKELVEQAVIVVTQFPERQAKNKKILEEYGLRDVEHAFMLATKSGVRGSPSIEQANALVIASEKALQRFDPKYPLYSQEEIGMYGSLLFQSLRWAATTIALRWEYDGYQCDNPLVATYVQLRRHFPERIAKTLPLPTLRTKDFNRINKNQPQAEAILAEECNIHFEEVIL